MKSFIGCAVLIIIIFINGCAKRKALVLNVNNNNTFNINQAREIIKKSEKRNKINKKQAERARKLNIERELKLASELKKYHNARSNQQK
jgi:hypothetical protein